MAKTPTRQDPADVQPPTPRVARRALVLAAVAGRGLLEQEDGADPQFEQNRQRMLDWLGEVGVAPEVEPGEWELLQRPVGKALRQSAIDAVWRLEGLAVLAWALRLRDLPPYDELTEVWPLLGAVGFLKADEAGKVLAASLRPAGELQQFRDQMFAIHWRLRQFSIKPEALDFRAFAKSAWFGQLDVSLCRFVENDLALGTHTLAEAPRELYERTCSATLERHQAINWLTGDTELYSETGTAT